MLNKFNRKDVSPLRYWVHAILPLVYDDSLSYYEVLAKISDKMNEVISGLNRNNEQVDEVTQFTTEQVQNLTMAFNNFQESMLTRQGEFENTLLEEQNSFEARLDGEIAQWEENTTEHFNQMFQGFLSAYQRQFGVVQTTGDSTTDVMSQNFITRTGFIGSVVVTADNREQYNDLDKLLPTRAYVYATTAGIANVPNGEGAGTVLCFNSRNKISGGYAQIFFAISGRTYYRLGWGNPVSWAVWQRYITNENVAETIGNSSIDVMSQNFITRTGFIGSVVVTADNRKQYNDLDKLLPSRAYVYSTTAGIANVPNREGAGTVLCFNYQNTRSGGYVQIFFASSGRAYYRLMWGAGTSWLEWKKFNTGENIVETIGNSSIDVMSQNFITRTGFIGSVVVTADNRKQYNDLDKLLPSRAYVYSTTAGIANVPNREGAGTVLCFNYQNTRSGGYVQIFFASSGRAYYRLMWGAGTSWLEWKRLLNENDLVEPDLYYSTIATYKRICVIGDSFSSGEIYSPTGRDYYSVSWLQIMARRNGVTATNYSKGGLTTRTWLAQYSSQFNADESSDLCFISLGINDASTGAKHVEIGEINDIGTDADTFYGLYSKIIELVMAKNANTRIVATSTPIGSSSSSYNLAIKDIAEHYNIPYIEVRTDSFFTSDYYINHLVSGHPTAPVYGGMSLAYERLFSKCNKEYLEYFSEYTPSN